MLHGPFSISLIGWVVSKGFFLFFLSLWPSCLVYSVYTIRCTLGFLYTIAFTYQKKKKKNSLNMFLMCQRVGMT